MSRVGKAPIAVPEGVDISIDGSVVKVKGKKGEMLFDVGNNVKAEMEDGSIVIKPLSNSKTARSMWGTSRARINNLVAGVSDGFTKKLLITGVGYRAALKGKDLQLQLAYSHDILYPIPEGIEVKCENPTTIEISGADKQLVGQVAAEIQKYRPPEPYKGKGIHYEGVQVVRKEGKKK